MMRKNNSACRSMLLRRRISIRPGFYCNRSSILGFFPGEDMLGTWMDVVGRRRIVSTAIAFKQVRFPPSPTRSFSRITEEENAVEAFNKEMELVFGRSLESPSHWGRQVASENLTAGVLTKRVDDGGKAQDEELVGQVNRIDTDNLDACTLTHVDDGGKASMVDVGAKVGTKRVAVASGRVLLGDAAFRLVAENNIAKGDVLTVAKIAGIQGAKQTANLIPLCHNIMLSGVDLSLSLNESVSAVDIRAQASATGPTGVEMEALTAVSVASLTVYDMCKSVSKNIQISHIQLESKTGGKSGDWRRDWD